MEKKPTPKKANARTRLAEVYEARIKSKLKYTHLPLFALLPLLTFFLANSEELSIDDAEILTFVVFNFAVMLVMFALAAALLRNIRKACILASLWVALFFLYGHLEDALKNFAIESLKLGPTKLIILFYVAATAGVIWLLVKSKKRKVLSLNKVLTVIAVILSISTVVQIIPKELSQREQNGTVTIADDASKLDPSQLPDVYYIVPDSYPRNDILKKTFDFDNTDFTTSLEQRGFYVAAKSNSNYAFTAFSVPSTLNMTYHSLPDPTADDSTFNLKESKVIVAMKSKGYKFVNVGTGWGASERIAQAADIKLSGGGGDKSIDLFGVNVKLSEFMIVYTKTTALRSVLDKKVKAGLSNAILDAIDAIRKIPDISDPTFTFVHLYVPHPPFIFDANGPIDSQKLEMTGDIFKDREHFLEQLKYTNKLLLETIDDIIKRSDKPPIIVLASDHGSATILGHPAEWGAPSDETADGIRERMGTLNSYYFPDKNYEKLYPTITPINTFPLILNQYLGGNYETFPDKSYFSNYTKKNIIYDVTELVK